MTDPVTITVSLYDSGCLPKLLRYEIGKVELAIIRVDDADYTSDMRVYLRQLRSCLEAVERGRS